MEIAAPVALHTRAHVRPGYGFTLDSPSINPEDPLDRVSDDEQLQLQPYRHQHQHVQHQHQRQHPVVEQADQEDQEGDRPAFDVGQAQGNHLGLTMSIEEEEDDSDISNDNDAADETRLRYERLQARGRAAELAYQLKEQQQKELKELEEAATKQQSKKTNNKDREHRETRDRSKSRSRPSTPATPIFSALFRRDSFATNNSNGNGSGNGGSAHHSQSPPVSSVAMDKATRRPSVTNLFGFARSSSSKSIHSGSSSLTNSPFPSPLTPLSPLPSFLSPKLPKSPKSPFLSPKTRRKAISTSNSGDDLDAVGIASPITPTSSASFSGFPGGTATIGSPLTRTPRRASPSRAMTLPDPVTVDLDRRYL